MKIKIFDESHEKDLEDDINNFIEEKNPDIIDIKYSISNSVYSEEQLYCFSALIMYKDSKWKNELKNSFFNDVHLNLLYKDRHKLDQQLLLVHRQF